MRSHSESEFSIRRLTEADVNDALELYKELTAGPKTARAVDFLDVLAHPGTQVFGATDSARVVAMATLHVLPNVTGGGRPYALVENVITSSPYRLQGIGRRVLDTVIEAAWHADCYKIMLLTGQARGAQGFYEAAGFSSDDKIGMIIRRD